MSNPVNTLLLERAYELVDELASDPAGRDDFLLQLIEANDMDNLLAQVQKIEAELAQEHFHSRNIVEA